MGEPERDIDDLIFPRKKTLTDLWRKEWDNADKELYREVMGMRRTIEMLQ